MSLSPGQLALYAGALLVLFLTPGPVWIALIARAVAGGFHAAWPLAMGVVVGDVIWPLLAIFGLAWVTSVYGGVLDLLRWVAVVLFLVMGWQLWRKAETAIGADSRLTRPGIWAGFAAGVAAILGNPKAILFYMGMLPGFFDMAQLTGIDIAIIVGLSAAIPFVCNLILALSIDRARRLLASDRALRRLNRISGGMLIGVGLVIAIS